MYITITCTRTAFGLRVDAAGGGGARAPVTFSADLVAADSQKHIIQDAILWRGGGGFQGQTWYDFLQKPRRKWFMARWPADS